MTEGHGNHFFDSASGLTATIKGFSNDSNWSRKGVDDTKAFYFAPLYFDGGGFINSEKVSVLPSGDSPRIISANYNIENKIPNGWSSLFYYGLKTPEGVEGFGLGINDGKYFGIEGELGWSAQVELAGTFASGLYIVGRVPLKSGWNSLEVVYEGGPIVSSPTLVKCTGEFDEWCPGASAVTSKNIFFIEDGRVYNDVAILTYQGGPNIPHDLILNTIVSGTGVGAAIGNDFGGSNFMGSIQNVQIYS